MLNNISKKAAGICIIITNIFTIVIDLLVIFKILPYYFIGGGRTGSYQASCQSAITGIVIIGFGTLVVAIACGLIKFERFKTFIKVWLWFSFVLSSSGIILNLLGITLFEKIVMTLVCVIQAPLVFRLARDKR